MLEFIIKSDEKVSDAKYSVWISFQDEPIDESRFYFCSGTALFVPGDKNKCWFDFHFYHTPDWNEIINFYINASAYIFSRAELLKLGTMVVCFINQYIAKHN
jgi:hypothetical protein